MSSESFPTALAIPRVWLLGNPNSGKSSVFNQLTGFKQKIGNFPGVTVEKKKAVIRISKAQPIELIDFPGTYSLYPNAEDEKIVVQNLVGPETEQFPDLIVYIADVTKLERHLLLFSQLADLNFPMVLALNMADEALKSGVDIDLDQLSADLGVPIVSISGRTGEGLSTLKAEIERQLKHLDKVNYPSHHKLDRREEKMAQKVKDQMNLDNAYRALLLVHHHDWLPQLSEQERQFLHRVGESNEFESLRYQVDETLERFDRFGPLIRRNQQVYRIKEDFSQRLDKILTHPIVGPLLFVLVMLLVFQAIFAWAEYPMSLIENLFGWLGQLTRTHLPEGWFTDLISDGLLAGLGGILVFVPQIAILFFLISLLEEVGYMARVAFLFDRFMQFFGLNGRSVVALISGGACAIPAIMSTRTIGNWKERIITIMVTPLISCSARIPVYTVLIGFVVPPKIIGGIFNLQGLAFMGLYLLGILGAFFSALIFKWILRSKEQSFLVLELPTYRSPVMKNVLLTVWNKVKTFSVEAGQVILIVSVILWILAYFGPGDAMQRAEQEARQIAQQEQMDETATENLIASSRLEVSFAGELGHFIEPVIRPLGYDWKIGIALITSFAAREVFVGTMATIYSIGSEEDSFRIRDRMAAERNPLTGEKVYNAATALSLLLFYVFAMQCMSTLAVVRKETQSWKWPLIQLVFMTALAYGSALAAYQLFS